MKSRRLYVVCGALTGFGLLVLVAFGFGYWRLDGNLHSVDINGALGGNRPVAPDNGAFNVLILGSDSRDGADRALAGGVADGTARSDTAMVLHVNAAHTRADVVSIPRDTLVDRPACGSAPEAPGAMFNTAFEVGGPVCAVKTAEALTGLRMDHYVQIDFAGFAKLVDAIGGVTVTTTVPIHDSLSRLDLPAGTHHLGGTQALAFVRTRHGVGDGSDLGRIELQQQMIRSIARQISGAGLLADPVKLFGVAEDVTKAVTTDSQLGSISSLMGFADELKGIGNKNITTVTMPTATAPNDPNRLVPDPTLDPQLWSALGADAGVPQSVLAVQMKNPATS
jgi:LCP family protein required for cell wall assembly